jgi:hypothetical protein
MSIFRRIAPITRSFPSVFQKSNQITSFLFARAMSKSNSFALLDNLDDDEMKSALAADDRSRGFVIEFRRFIFRKDYHCFLSSLSMFSAFFVLLQALK